MTPELGKYADTVLSAYAVSIVLLVGLVLVSIWQAKKVKKRLQDIENRARKNG